MINQFNYFKGVIFNHEEQLAIYLIEHSEKLRSLLRTNPDTLRKIVNAIWKNYASGITDIETISMICHLHEKKVIREYILKNIKNKNEKTI